MAMEDEEIVAEYEQLAAVHGNQPANLEDDLDEDDEIDDEDEGEEEI
ncbi:hypothetical protein [Candidatus Phycosocius spiralis]|uniref:Uncharacterized protein n=1 Tax=Candidatus Phycosocius spiralis TaxID=2815099 RepID=A0ABQ4PSL2_9PROT|nr:hypothetical protein [Candidatus Phycosocius spiralis]GIU65992.1 hypothetical protein PsB1_0146 [Candidatus Phycosocius spiralis]